MPLTDLQIGDLVFSPGGRDVGIYLGDGDVIGASARTFQVGVRSLAAGSSAVRVTLPAPAAAQRRAAPGAGATGACGAAPPAPGGSARRLGWLRATARSRARRCASWACYRHALRCDAARPTR